MGCRLRWNQNGRDKNQRSIASPQLKHAATTAVAEIPRTESNVRASAEISTAAGRVDVRQKPTASEAVDKKGGADAA